MLRITFIAVAITIIAGTIAVIDTQSDEFTPQKVPRQAERTSVFAVGIVEGRTDEVELRFQPIGCLAEFRVQVGDEVARDQVLASLDDGTHRQQFALAMANLEIAQSELSRLVNGTHEEEQKEAGSIVEAKQAALNQAIRTLKRTQELFNQKAVSLQSREDQQCEVDRLSAEVAAAKAHFRRLQSAARPDELRIAQAKVAAARVEVELTRIALERTELKSPTAGQIVKVQAEKGELTGPHAEKPVVIMTDTSQLFVRAYVDESDALRVKRGMLATIRVDGTDLDYSGIITTVSPTMRTKAVITHAAEELYDVREREVMVRLDPSPGLVLGMRVEVEFKLE